MVWLHVLSGMLVGGAGKLSYLYHVDVTHVPIRASE
jgi:hypothetical protein